MWTVVSFFLSSFSLQTERSETRIRENGQFLMALMGGGRLTMQIKEEEVMMNNRRWRRAREGVGSKWIEVLTRRISHVVHLNK